MMPATEITFDRERIVAAALRPVASELRLIDAADLIAMLRFERFADLADLVASAAELYFQPGTLTLGIGGDYRLDWAGKPCILLDLELKPDGVAIFARLTLQDDVAAVEINHIAFENASADPEVNTLFLQETLDRTCFRAAPSRAA